MDNLLAELVESITDQINNENIQSLHNLRRTCRVLERQTNKTFLKRCFGTRKITIATESMNKLIKVMDLPKFGHLVLHLIVDAFFGEQSQASASKLTETLEKFAGKTLESITFIHTAEPGPFAKHMARIGHTGPFDSLTLFIQRFCDITALVDAFIHIMELLDIKILRLSIPGAEDFETAYAIGPWVLNGDQEVVSNLHQLDLHVFPTSLDIRTGIQSAPEEDAMALASFINSAPQLSQLKLSFAAESLEAYDRIWLTQLPNTLFEALDMNNLKDLTIADWPYPHWQSLLAFFQKHQTITRLKMSDMQIDAFDIPLHRLWVHILGCLSLSSSLVEFSWKHLDTTSTARLELRRIPALPLFRPVIAELATGFSATAMIASYIVINLARSKAVTATSRRYYPA